MEILDTYPALLVPAIFLARVMDVTLGTFRSIVVFRGHPAMAAAIGFLEILIWIMAVSQVIRQMDAWPLTLAYAGGFACGNYLGILLEARIGIGRESLRIISHAKPGTLTKSLRSTGLSVLTLTGLSDGAPAEVHMVTVERRKMPQLLDRLRAADPDAEYTISDVKSLQRADANAPRRWPIINAGWRVRGKRK